MRCFAIVFATAVFSGVTASAVNPATWQIDETITRLDSEVTWTSPTPIDLGLDQYDYDYEITQITANSVDVTELIGESFDLIEMGQTADLPVTLIDSPLDDPETGTMADVLIRIDQDGFGQEAFTNITLGSVPFGPVMIPITTIRVEATINVAGFNFQPADYNRDGVIDPSDYQRWVSDYASTESLWADGNDDGLVDAADYTVWRDRFDSPLDRQATTVPEPGGLLMVGISLSLGVFSRTRRAKAE